MNTYVPNCDAPGAPSVYVVDVVDGKPVYACRCMVCGRCNHHTGNSNQGHYWAYCHITKQMEDFHFCCPDDCELVAKGLKA
jgi:hypothetical protein